MTTVISVENLGKKYLLSHQAQRGSYLALRDELAAGASNLARRLFGRSNPADAPSPEEFWALKDVCFEVKQGARIGIIGRNGAGKSTLLKILSRITEPTSGSVRLRGRVASLLEVGTGFHPELTGRENIYLNGAILGMGRSEIRTKFDEIVDFAEIERFLDTPVKRYSSGMYVRLAFAVAAHLEPEILVVDEVLAVGDAQFQKKCLGKMRDVSGREGRTILFVSHNMSAVSTLCNQALWLEKGAVRTLGDAQETVARYLTLDAVTEATWEGGAAAPGKKAEVTGVSVTDSAGKSADCIRFSDPFTVHLRYEIREPLVALTAAIRLKTPENLCVLVSSDKDSLPVDDSPRPVGSCHARCHFPGGLFRPGRYYLNVGLFREGAETYDFREDVVAFDISPEGMTVTEQRDGILTPVLDWEMQVNG